MRRTTILWLGVGTLSLVILGFLGYRATASSRPIARITGVVSAHWAKSGKAIFYIAESGVNRAIFRYDLSTKRTTRYSVPPFDGDFDISPDETRIVCIDTHSVYATDLITGTKQKLYTVPPKKLSPDLVSWIPNSFYWLPTGEILFFHVDDPHSRTYLLDPTTRTVRALPPDTVKPGKDGRVFLADDLQVRHRYILFDKTTRTSRRLPAMPADFNYGNSDDFLYLSQDELIYRVWPIINGFQSTRPQYYRLDLHTMRTTRWRDLPVNCLIQEFSPNMRQYFVLSSGFHSAGEVFVYQMPSP